LRKSERETAFDPLDKIENPLEKLSVETSHPLWLLEKWQRQFGFDETAKLARANNSQPPTAFRATNQNDSAIFTELETAGAAWEKSTIAANAFRVSGANQTIRRLVAEGRIYLQDEASQLVGETVVSLESGVESRKFLDVCAAPGSKTTQVRSAECGMRKSLFVAGDFTVPRVRILKETVEKFGSKEIEIVRYDARNLPFADESFDLVLVDAPCTGTGTIRHNPEIRFHLKETDFRELADLQQNILQSAARVVKKNGRIVYSTCSLEPEEGEEVAANFLAKNGNFKAVAEYLPEKFVNGNGFARTFPQRADADGFFIAILHRTN
jgi:16S rRNA (cytosine967-C5)-methyltransferase